MSVEPQTTPLSNRSRTPTRSHQTLVGILGTPPADYRLESHRENRTPSRSPIRQVTEEEEKPQLQNKSARTIKDIVIFRSELSDSPFIGGKRNPNYKHKSFLSSDALTAPDYEAPEKADQRPHFRPGSRHRKSHRELAPSITRPINYPYLSPHKQTPREKSRVPAEEIYRRLDFEEVQTVKKPVPAVKTSVPQEVPIQTENKYLTYEYQEEERHQTPTRKGVLTPRQEQNVAIKQVIKIETPNSKYKTTMNVKDILQPQSARDISPVNQRFQNNQNFTPQRIPRNQSLPKVSFENELATRPPREESYAAIRQSRPSPIGKVDSSPLHRLDSNNDNMPYYLKKRAKELSSAQTPEKTNLKPEAGAQDVPKERSLTPTQRAKTPTEVKKSEAASDHPIKVEIPEVKTPLSQHSQGSNGSNASGKDLVCDKCVNKLVSAEKHGAKAHQREDARAREQEVTKLNKQILDKEREHAIAEKEKARRAALANREVINQKENEKAARRRNPPADEMHHLDKIFENEDRIARDKLNKSAEFRSVIRDQVEQKRQERERERAREKSPEFGTTINISGEFKNPRVPTVRELSEELRSQIHLKESQKQAAHQTEKERARAQGELAHQIAKEEEILAKQKQKQKKEELKRALEQAIHEKRAIKEQEKNTKYNDLDNINRIQAFAKDEEERKREARKNRFDDHLNGLKQQIDEVQRKKREEKEKSREPYATTISGLGEHSPEFIQNKKAEQREVLKGHLLNQIEDKRNERKREKERNPQSNNVSLPIENNYNNPYLDYSKPLAQILREQIETKLQEKEKQARETKELVRQSDAMATRIHEEMQKKAKEEHREKKEALKDALLQDIHQKARTKEHKHYDKQTDLELANALSQKFKDDLDRSRLKEKIAHKEHVNALKNQIQGSIEKKEREKSEKKIPTDVTLTGIVNRNRDPKLYPCTECTQKFPKHRMTKKKQLKII